MRQMKSLLLLLCALSPISLMPARQSALKQRIAKVAVPAKPRTVRADQAAWLPYLPGIEIAVLRQDVESETALWRIAPGASIPPHPHDHAEECLILQGSLLVDGAHYHAGDYLQAHIGDLDSAFLAPEGALLLLRAGHRPTLRTARSA
jgi:anti-sigma factor ChrR (cupin superfamily)